MKKLSKWIYALLAVLIIAAGSAAYYFLYYIKTPEYTLKIIADGYKAHDVYKVHKHIDIDRILNSYLDETIKNELPEKDNPFVQALLPALKQVAISLAKDNIDKDIMGLEPTIPTAEKTGDKPAKDLRNAFDSSAVKSASSKKIDDTTVEIQMVVTNKRTKEDINIPLRAKRLDDGTWRIYEIPGMYQLVKKLNTEK